MSDKLIAQYRDRDQVLPYFAAVVGKDFEQFMFEFITFCRMRKYSRIPDDTVAGTYAALFKTLGTAKVKDYEARVRGGAFHMLDLFPLAFFLDVTIEVYTVDASGTAPVLKQVINAGKATTFAVALTSGTVSLALETARTKSHAQAQHQKAVLAVHEAKAKSAKDPGRAALVALLERANHGRTVDLARRYLDARNDGKIQSILSLADAHSLITHHAKAGGDGQAALTRFEIIDALLGNFVAKVKGEAHIPHAELLASLHARLG